MDNFNESDVMQDDKLPQILSDWYDKLADAEKEEDVNAILSIIERLERINHQRNEDVNRYNQTELEYLKFEENKRQFDENQQREIERWDADKEFKRRELQLKSDDLKFEHKPDIAGIIIDVSNVLFPVGIAVGNGIFLKKSFREAVLVEDGGTLWYKNAIGRSVQKGLETTQRNLI